MISSSGAADLAGELHEYDAGDAVQSKDNQVTVVQRNPQTAARKLGFGKGVERV
jgi:hypothetical protein